MNLILKKLSLAKQYLELSGKPIFFMALILREESCDRWDLIISAQWLSSDYYSDVKYIVENLRRFFSQDEIIKLSNIRLLSPDEPLIKELIETQSISQLCYEFSNITLENTDINKAYLFK